MLDFCNSLKLNILEIVIKLSQMHKDIEKQTIQYFVCNSTFSVIKWADLFCLFQIASSVDNLVSK